MKIINAFKIGKRTVLTLDSDLPDNFKNHSDVKVDNHIFSDAIIPMSSSNNLRRKDVSILTDKDIDFKGKELILI